MDLIGWTATAVFTASYFFKREEHLRRVQIVAACLWIVYGALAGTVPVVVANVLVAGAALLAGKRWDAGSPQRGTQT